jgi:hypothetical protein
MRIRLTGHFVGRLFLPPKDNNGDFFQVDKQDCLCTHQCKFLLLLEGTQKKVTIYQSPNKTGNNEIVVVGCRFSTTLELKTSRTVLDGENE